MTPTALPALPALRSCVGDPERFVAQHWARTPLHHRVGGSALHEALTLADVDQLLTSATVHFPDVTLVKDGQPLDPATYCRDPHPERGGARIVEVARVFALFGEGATIQLQGAQLRWTPLARFCRELELELGIHVQANVYITPPGSCGLELHADPHDVFAVQLIGSKHWEVYEPRVGAQEAGRAGQLFDGAGQRSFDGVLREGELLYVPRGSPHRAQSTSGPSIHVTLGLITTTWLAAVREVLAHGQEALRLQESLPLRFAFGGPDAAQQMARRLRELARWLDAQDPDAAASWVNAAFWAGRRARLEGQLEQLLQLDAMDDSRMIRHRHGVVAMLGEQGDRIVLTIGDRALDMPDWIRDAVTYVLDHGSFRVGELQSFLDAPSRHVLVRRLIREGLLEQVLDP